MTVKLINGQGERERLRHLIMKYQTCGKRGKARPLNLLMEPTNVRRPKTLQAIRWW